MLWPVCQARRFPPAVAAAMTRAWGWRRARRRMNSASHVATTVPVNSPVPMVQAVLSAMTAVVVHGKRDSSRSPQGTRIPRRAKTPRSRDISDRADRHRLVAVRVYSPQRARQAARSRAEARRSVGGDRDGIGDLSDSGWS